MNLMAKVKLVFYGVLVFSIYLIAIFYSFGIHKPNSIHMSTNQNAQTANETIEKKNIRIKFTLLDTSGKAYSERVVMIKNKQTKGKEKINPLMVQTDVKGEVELTIEPGSYIMYLEKNPELQKQVTISSKDDGKWRELIF